MRNTILFLVNVDWFFVSHRLPIALEAIRAGHQVHLACSFTDQADYLSSLGINLHELPLSRGGTGPWAELKTFWFIFQTIRKIRPDIVHCVTIKPMLYGGIAGRILGIPGRVASVSGLGYVFVSSGIKARALRLGISGAYRLALKSRNAKVIFQNPQDRDLLLSKNIIYQDQAVMISGSGVDLDEYQFLPEPDGTPVVAMASRLLTDKDVREFVEAARILRTRGTEVRFWLIGDTDPENPAAVSKQELEAWEKEGVVEILGHRKDIPELFSQANMVCLPSYYGEGLPRVLVEAAACGRAVITTDHPGCRDAIEPEKTGLLVPVRDADALADAVQYLVEKPDLRQKMGQAGRRLAEREFSIQKVVQAHMEIYEQLVGEDGR